MKRFIVIIWVCIPFLACEVDQLRKGSEASEQKVGFDASTAAAITGTDKSWQQMSLRELIGQTVCLLYDADLLQNGSDQELRSFLTKYPVGSIFLANWAIGDPDETESRQEQYRRIVQELSVASSYPILFSEDFEVGLGTSFPSYTNLTREMGLGATRSPDHASRFGEIIAREARSVGINWLLHPVADLNQNPFNHLTNTRSIGEDAELARPLLQSQITAMQRQSVVATAKHFPGDGTDVINQHFATSAVQMSLAEWRDTQGALFKDLIDHGVLGIMPGHISFPAFQKEKVDGEFLPASLSKELVTDLLKGEMGFQGIVVSDALNMAGMSGYFSGDLEQQIESFKAGCDIMLWPSLAYIDTLEQLILRDEIPRSRLEDAVSRVWAVKESVGLLRDDYKYVEKLSDDDLMRHQNMAVEIAENSITLVSDKHNNLPIGEYPGRKVLVISVSENDESQTLIPLVTALEERGCLVEHENNLSYFTHGDRLSIIEKEYDQIIFCYLAGPSDPWGSIGPRNDQALTMWSSNMISRDKVISISFGDPYIQLMYLPQVWIRINAYHKDANSQNAVVKAIFGEIPFQGTSPVSSTRKRG